MNLSALREEDSVCLGWGSLMMTQADQITMPRERRVPLKLSSPALLPVRKNRDWIYIRTFCAFRAFSTHAIFFSLSKMRLILPLIDARVRAIDFEGGRRKTSPFCPNGSREQMCEREFPPHSIRKREKEKGLPFAVREIDGRQQLFKKTWVFVCECVCEGERERKKEREKETKSKRRKVSHPPH